MGARDFVLVQLDGIKLPGWPSHQIRRKAQPPENPRDLALAEQIRVGVIKNLALLDHLVTYYSNRSKIDPLVRKILVIGLYQIRFLDRVPPSAAVDEAVEQSRRMGRKHAAGFVNAVLRRAVREPDVPLPMREKDPIGYATLTLSHPEELVLRQKDTLTRFPSVPGEGRGEGRQTDALQRALDICEHNNREPPTLVRLFRNVTVDQLAAPNVQIIPHEQPGIYVVEGARRAILAEWASKALAQAQDATSAAVVGQMQLQPNQDVLDRCAGMGTKSLQIHDELSGTGWIMAVEPSEERYEVLRKLLQKRRIENIAVIQARWLREITELKKPAFDRVLIDAPCSNSGVLARRPEARFSQTQSAIESVVKLQDQILDDTAVYVRAGGVIVYSTCSIWREENQARVAAFVSRHREFREVSSKTTFPSTDSASTCYRDGGFVSVLSRR